MKHGRPEGARTARLAQQARQPPILEDASAGLAGGAVADRVLLELDPGQGRAADVAGLAETAVDAVGALVGSAVLAQLEPAAELRADRRGQPRHLLVVEVGREGVRRQSRGVEDLVRPGAPLRARAPQVPDARARLRLRRW